MNKEEADLIIAEQNKSKEEILKAVAKVKSDYHELCKLKDMRIADLEKENAELKKTVLQFQKDSYCGVCHFKTKTQLKQATEIIKEFVEWANWQGNSKCPSFKSIQDKAEQFIKNSEV